MCIECRFYKQRCDDKRCRGCRRLSRLGPSGLCHHCSVRAREAAANRTRRRPRPFARRRFAAAAAALLAAAVVQSSALLPQTDGSAEPTILRIERTAAVFVGPFDTAHATVQETPDVQHATLIDDDTAGWRHVYWQSGPAACVFTARMQDDGHLADVAGGRDCGPADDGRRCAFIEQGYTVFAASGRTCTGWRIGGCGLVC